MNIPPISYPHFRFDNVEMAVRKSAKRAELHRAWQEDWAEEQIHLDFFDEKAQSWFELKYLNL